MQFNIDVTFEFKNYVNKLTWSHCCKTEEGKYCTVI